MINLRCKITLLIVLELTVNVLDINVLGQNANTNDTLCSRFHYDTLTANFLLEINIKEKLYFKSEATPMLNHIYLNKGITKKTIGELYNSDTLLLQSPNYVMPGVFAKSCLNLYSISMFYSKIDKFLLTKKDKTKFRKSTLINKNGLLYLQFFAKMIVINFGEHNWMIPKIYSSECLNSDNKYEGFCEKKFSNTLVISSILEFRYSCDKTVNKW